MIIESLVKVTGYCDNDEELEQYLYNIKQKPADIYSRMIMVNPGDNYYGKIKFEIEYVPLIDWREIDNGK